MGSSLNRVSIFLAGGPAFLSLCLTIMVMVVLVDRSAVGAERPNLLLITADDLGLQLSCYGDSIAKTPHIDRLASRSVQFQTAYVAQASCSPSRSAMFTGRYPHGNGHYGLANADVGFRVHQHLIEQLLPNVLKRAGYRTGIIGKLHVNPEQSFQFDMRHNEGFGSRDIRLQNKFAREFISQDGKGESQDGASEPWFLMFNLFDPHVARSRNADGQRGAQFFPNQVQGFPAKLVAPDDVPAWPWQQIDAPQQRTKIAGYYNCVHRIDAAIGMLMKTLRQSGHADDTVIVFLGDHGPPFARGKTSCYEAGLRVPFLVRWPGVSQPHRSDRLVSSVDIYPTLLDAAHIERPADLHGQSLRPVLTGPVLTGPVLTEPGLTGTEDSVDWRDTLVGEFHYHGAKPLFPRRAITDGRYKLIHNLRAGELSASATVDGDQAPTLALKLPKGHPAREAMARLKDPPTWELYDLQEDPGEFHNRAGDAQLAEAEARLKAKLNAWAIRTKDPFVDRAFLESVEAKYQNAP